MDFNSKNIGADNVDLELSNSIDTDIYETLSNISTSVTNNSGFSDVEANESDLEEAFDVFKDGDSVFGHDNELGWLHKSRTRNHSDPVSSDAENFPMTLTQLGNESETLCNEGKQGDHALHVLTFRKLQAMRSTCDQPYFPYWSSNPDAPAPPLPCTIWYLYTMHNIVKHRLATRLTRSNDDNSDNPSAIIPFELMKYEKEWTKLKSDIIGRVDGIKMDNDSCLIQRLEVEKEKLQIYCDNGVCRTVEVGDRDKLNTKLQNAQF